jgi:hypothetical protein
LVDVFASIDRGILVEDPYPHLVVENALPAEIADTLLAAMPPVHVFLQGHGPGSNVRFALPSPQAFDHPDISAEWKEALRICVASLPPVLERMLSRFSGYIRQSYPDFERKFGPVSGLRAAPRYAPTRQPHEVGMDAQMVINTPALSGGTSVRGPHLDRPDKLISGLLYLRSPGEDSVGGELQLCAPTIRRLAFDDVNLITHGSVRVVRTYPYRHNLLVLPFCSPVAVHGVSPRGQTSNPRYHLHLVGEMAAPLFDIPQPTRAQQMWARARRRLLQPVG